MANEGTESTDGDRLTEGDAKAAAKGGDTRAGLSAIASTGSGARRSRSNDLASEARDYAADAAARSGAKAPTFSVVSSSKGTDGRTHVRLQQTHDGLKVWGADVVVHATDSELVGLAGSVATDLDSVNVRARRAVDEKSVLSRAKTDVFGRTAVATERESTEEIVFIDGSGTPHVAFHTEFYNELDRTFAPGLWNHVFDAATGDVLAKWNAIHTAQASGPGGNPRIQHAWTNELDVEPQGTSFVMTTARQRTTNLANAQAGDGNDVVAALTGFNDAAINDAHGYAEITLEMLKTWMGHDSIDDNGFKIHSRVHYGVNYENAFWNGTQMTYGDGKTMFHPLSGAIDVVAHEIHHGFTAKHSNLAYSGEPGGLNESFSDVAGKAAEFFYKTNANWDLGADIFKAKGALRYMCNPSRDGSSIETAADMTPDLDPHYSSGPMNKAFCRLSKRFSAGDPEGTATASGVRKAATPFFLANSSYWTSSTTFTQACQGTIDAARALGYSSDDVAAIKTSWIDVGVYCDGAIPPPPACNETLSGATGEVTSPNWPNMYPNSFVKTWCIDAPAGKQAKLTFDEFDTEAGYDFVAVAGGNGVEVSKTSGTVKPSVVTGARVYITFRTDSIVTKKGWKASWTSQ